MHPLGAATPQALSRYRSALNEPWGWLPFGLLFAAACSIPGMRRLLARLPRRALAGVLFAALGVCGVLWAWHLRWLCDDAYISFQYAKNLASGLGLVFNAGERV